MPSAPSSADADPLVAPGLSHTPERAPGAVRRRVALAGFVRGDRSVWLLPVLTGLALSLWGITGPDLAPDEIVTWSAVTRPFSRLRATLHNVDVVFAPYYTFMHVWTRAFGDSLLALRLPSALAMTAAAGVVAHLGRQLFDRKTGVVAGLIFCAMPFVSQYAQQARPYAFATLFAALATLFLVRALHRPRSWWWVPYGLAATLVGWSHLIGFFGLVLAHGIVVVVLAWRWRKPALALWVPATAIAAAAVAPLAILGSRQKAQIAWIPLTALRGVPEVFSVLMGSGVLAGILIALAVLGAACNRRSVLIAGSLAAAPFAGLALYGISQPVFQPRYLLFTCIGWALLAACAVATTRRAIAFAIAALLLMTALPPHLANRATDGHGQSGFSSAAARIKTNQKPGDAIVYGWNSWLRLGMDYYLPPSGRPTDAYLASSASGEASFVPRECVDFVYCLDRRGRPERVWVICTGDREDPLTCMIAEKSRPVRKSYTALFINHYGDLTLGLYRRTR